MNALIRWSLANRLIVLALAVAVLVGGTVVTLRMPVDVFPDLTAPSVTVITEAHGLAPQEVETLVTFPIEAAINGASGVRRVRSSSATGISVVWVEFAWGTDIYQARQVVNEKLQLARATLPSEVEQPILTPISSIMGEIMFIALTSESHSPMELGSTADWVIRPRLLAVPGVSQVVPIGGDEKQYQVLIAPEQLAASGVSLTTVIEAVSKTNQNTSAGFYLTGGQEYLIHGVGRVRTLEEIANTVVTLHEGQPLLLSQVADVRIGPALKRGDGAAMGKPAVIMSIQKQPDANTLALTRQLDQILAQIQPALPQGMRINTQIFRQADFIQVSIDNLVDALRDGAIVVVVILWLFLMNIRATVISLLAVPLSLLVAVLTLWGFGATINTMTLGGMAIAIGALVDDAIIDVENVVRRLRENALLLAVERAPPLTVTLKASLEIRPSITFATFVILLVFVPLFFLSGVEGRLLAPLGVAYVVALFASLVVAVSVTPVLCFLLLPQSPGVTAGKESLVVHVLKGGYQKLLGWVLHRPMIVITIALVLFVGTLAFLPFLGRAFLPEFNEGTLTINTVTLPGTSLAESDRLGQMVDATLLSFPEVRATARRTGRAKLDEHAQSVEASEIEVGLAMTDRSKEALLQDLRRALTVVPGMNITIGQPISHRIDHMLSGTRANIAVKIFGDNLQQLRILAQEVRTVMTQIPGVVDLSVEQQANIPILQLRFNRDRIARVGLHVQDVAEAVETAFWGKTVSRVLEGQRSFDLVVRYADTSRQDIATIRATLIDTPLGGKVPLDSLADVSTELGPNTINRENVQRRIVVSCNVAGRDLQGVVHDIQQRIAANVTLPQGYYVVYGGQFESAEEASRTIGFLSVLVLGGIVLLLTTALGSLRDALIILVNLPLALIGGVAGVFLSGGVLSVASLIGFITLFGIATRNGIMLVAHMRHLMEEEGEGFRQAVERGALERLSPILMTALSAGLALLPLAFRGGEPGSEILTPMAIVILCGLLSSTALNMLVVPALYLTFGHPSVERTERPALVPHGAMLPVLLWCSALAVWPDRAAAEESAPELTLDLPTALERALRDNPDLMAERQALGSAQGRVQQAALLFQENPRLSVDGDYRHRRFATPAGKSGTDTEARLLQEIEIAGQPGYRREAAAKHLAQAEWFVADVERLLRLEVTRTFYELLALQEKIAAQRQVLSTQASLLQAGEKRFARGDISVLERDTLRVDKDRAHSDLVSREDEQVRIEQQLRSLLSLEADAPLVAVGNLSTLLVQGKGEKLLTREELQACAVAQRPDLKAARLTLEGREAELRLAQARRIPNISVGPLYRLDNDDQVVGGALVVPLPLFNRNQQEIATALANLAVSRTEAVARERTVRQEVSTASARVQLTERRLAAYGNTYVDDLAQSLAFTQKAYETGEVSIFEFSVALDRLVQARFRYIDAVLASLQAGAELDVRAASCPNKGAPEQRQP